MSVERFAPLDIAPRAASIDGVPSHLTPSARRRSLARRLYRDEPHERPAWLEEQLLRPGQVAALFQVSRRTVNDWARAGKLDSIITPGGHRRFRAKQVRALLSAMRWEPAV